MIEVRQTAEFSRWLRSLRDANAFARIVGRIRRMEQGNPGDSRPVGHGIMEMRIDYGPGYRVYYLFQGPSIILLWRGQAYAGQRHPASSAIGKGKLMLKTTRFDAAEYLDTEERQVAYITAALETGDADFVRDALGLVARARGMGQVAKMAGLNRESLYRALGETGNPEFTTVMRIVRALGLTLTARPAEKARTVRKRRVA
jgi:probable addiction module antidote protein/putative addiction module killer protein